VWEKIRKEVFFIVVLHRNTVKNLDYEVNTTGMLIARAP
jgi:hypothetical protein